MRYLGLDLGSKTLGIATSDLTGMLSTTLTTGVEYIDLKEGDANKIASLYKLHNFHDFRSLLFQVYYSLYY